MAQIVQLKRSALSGKVPDTGSLNLGELALNTYDGKIFFRRSGSTDTVQEVITTNVINTGSVTLTGTLTAGSIIGSISASNGVVSGSSQIIGILSSLNSYTSSIDIWSSSLATTGSNQFKSDQNITGSLRATLTGSFGSLNVNDTLNINHGIATISGSLGITSDLTVLGQVNARQFNIGIISSSILYQSGSNKFGDTSDDTHQFTGSVQVTGSLYLNGIDLSQGNNSGSFSGSFQGDGSRLRGVISDDIPRDGYDYNSNITGSGSISDFNVNSDKYQIDFAQSQSTAVGTPVGFKGFLSNVSGSTQILPTLNSIDFVVGNNLVASIGASGITATAAAGTVSGSSQIIGILNALNTYTASQSTASLATTGSNSFIGNQNISGTIFLTGSIIPTTDNTYDLGSSTKSFRHLYVSSGSIYLNGAKVLSSTAQELQFTTDTGQSIKILEAGTDTITLQSADGNITLASSGNGDVVLDPTTGVIGLKGTTTLYAGNKIVSSDGNAIQIGNDLAITGSLITTTGNINGINLSTFSSSIASTLSNQNTATSSYETKGRGIVSGSSQITYTNISSIPSGIVSGSSQILGGSGLVSGSSQITFNGISSIPAGIVSGSLQTIANLPTGVISGSIQVLGGSGIISSSAQLNNTTITNLSVTNLTVVNETASVLFSSGSNRFGDFGDDVHDFTGSVKISGSFNLIGSSTATSYNGIHNGTINSTNGVVSGSSQITYTNISSIPSGIVSGSTQVTQLLPTGVVSGSVQTIINLPTGTVSGSSQVVGILSSLNTYTGSNDTTNTAQNTRLTTIESVTGSYETKGRGIVSGSSQIDVMSTTNIARLATTGSNIFIGNQTISGSTIFRNNSNGTNVSIGGTAYGIRIDNGGTFSTGRSTIFGVDNTFIGSYQPLGLQGSTVYIGTSGTDIMTVASTGVSVVGNISAGATSISYVGPSQYGGIMFPRGNILFSNTNGQNQMYMSSNAYLNAGGTWSYRTASQYAGYMAIDNGAFSVALAGNSGAADSAVTWTTPISITNAGVTTFAGNVVPEANGTRDLGSSALRWSTVYTSDLSLNNGIGDWTIVEGEDDLFLYNNKKGKVYKFALTEVDPNIATPKKS
jgi:hypothetical protein